MIRLTKQQPGDHEVVVRVEGRLDSTTIADFRILLESVGPATTLSLDLGGLTSIDSVARDFLIGLRRQGCRLQGASLYINRLIEEASA